MIRSQCFATLRRATLSWGILATVACLAAALASAQAPQFPAPQGSSETHPGHRLLSDIPGADNLTRSESTQLTPQQKMRIMKANFETSKNDAAELAALAKGLREELNKPNLSELSAEFMTRLEKIQKLAKKIREETKGF